MSSKNKSSSNLEKIVLEKLKKDKHFAIAILQEDGELLASVSDDFKKDPEIVMTAVTQNPRAIKFANENLTKDKEIMGSCIQKNPEALICMHDDLKKDAEFIKKILDSNINVIKYFDIGIKENFNMIEYVKNNAKRFVEFFDKNEESAKQIFDFFGSGNTMALVASFVMNNYKLFKHVPEYLKKNKDFFEDYACRLNNSPMRYDIEHTKILFDNMHNSLSENKQFIFIMAKILHNGFIYLNAIKQVTGKDFKAMFPDYKLVLDIDKINKEKIKIEPDKSSFLKISGEIHLLTKQQYKYKKNVDESTAKLYKIKIPDNAIIETTGRMFGKIDFVYVKNVPTHWKNPYK